MSRINDGYFGEEPWSYGSVERVKEHNPNISRKKIVKQLAKNEIFTRFKQHRKAKKYSPIFVYRKRELFQADVVFFTDPDMVRANEGFKYLFTCIDCFSKMAWAFPLKNNTCQNVMRCFKQIIEMCGQKPERLNSDRGSELICKDFAQYLASQKIHHYLSYSIRKCPIIERFNLTIQQLLYKIMAHNRSLQWTSFLSQAMRVYLNRKHSTIGMSPLEAEKDTNGDEVRKKLLEFFHKRGRRKMKPNFMVNDTVRIWKQRHAFQRGYDENYSIEYFKIARVLTNLPVARYILKDSKGEEINGKFFDDELELFIPGERFDIQVLGERATPRGKELLVHYVGYPRHMDEWVAKKAITSL